MLHIPLSRAGRPYRSLQTMQLNHVATGEPVAEVSQANRGLISRDSLQIADHARALAEIPVSELLAITRRAAVSFAEDELPIDPIDGVLQSPADYIAQLSATTGMPQALCRFNMDKVRYVLAEMETVLAGLTRGIDLAVLDRGWTGATQRVSYMKLADSLGAVLPSNSPGVHSLWLPAVPLKVPLLLKPGSQEPWTPFRVAQAFVRAGLPAAALSLYPTDHGGAAEILLRTDRSMLFGDANTVRGWVDDPRVQIHGPGYSKVVLAADRHSGWRDELELMTTSIAENGGRSCLNASGVWVTADGREIARAVAEQLARVEARGLQDPAARLAAFPRAGVAHAISDFIDRQLQLPGAEDVTSEFRPAGRVAEVDGLTYLLPTVVWCEDSTHPLANSEFLFPFAAVVEASQHEILDRIGPTLVATVLTDDPVFRNRAIGARNIDRLNLGRFPTSRVSWDQPHEGNLFEHLYRQRAFQTDEAPAA